MRVRDLAYTRPWEGTVSRRPVPGTGPHEIAVAGKGRSYRVSSISRDYVRHLFEPREALERQAARLAAQRGEQVVFGDLASRSAAAATPLSTEDPDHTTDCGLVADLDDARHGPRQREGMVALDLTKELQR